MNTERAQHVEERAHALHLVNVRSAHHREQVVADLAHPLESEIEILVTAYEAFRAVGEANAAVSVLARAGKTLEERAGLVVSSGSPTPVHFSIRSRR